MKKTMKNRHRKSRLGRYRPKLLGNQVREGKSKIHRKFHPLLQQILPLKFGPGQIVPELTLRMEIGLGFILDSVAVRRSLSMEMVLAAKSSSLQS
jgi:hypothetical protein